MCVEPIVRQQYCLNAFVGEIQVYKNADGTGLLFFRFFYCAGKSGLHRFAGRVFTQSRENAGDQLTIFYEVYRKKLSFFSAETFFICRCQQLTGKFAGFFAFCTGIYRADINIARADFGKIFYK